MLEDGGRRRGGVCDGHALAELAGILFNRMQNFSHCLFLPFLCPLQAFVLTTLLRLSLWVRYSYPLDSFITGYTRVHKDHCFLRTGSLEINSESRRIERSTFSACILTRSARRFQVSCSMSKAATTLIARKTNRRSIFGLVTKCGGSVGAGNSLYKSITIIRKITDLPVLVTLTGVFSRCPMT